MKRRVLGLAIAVLLVGMGIWLLPDRKTTPPRVSEAEARAYLDQIVVAARAKDFEGVCAFNHAVPNCRAMLEYVGEGSVPTAPPTVTASRYDPKRGEEGDGMILVVEGIDGRGKPYRTEVFVFRDEETGDLTAVNALYWSGARFSSNNDPSNPDPPASPS